MLKQCDFDAGLISAISDGGFVGWSFLVTATLASALAILRPVLGVWIWAGFPIVATVLARRGGGPSPTAD